MHLLGIGGYKEHVKVAISNWPSRRYHMELIIGKMDYVEHVKVVILNWPS
jgi:hypothetical protein